jgi:hypothetical protein
VPYVVLSSKSDPEEMALLTGWLLGILHQVGMVMVRWWMQSAPVLNNGGQQ